MPLQTVKLASLVQDWDLYPRHEYSSDWVLTIARQMDEGAQFPPPVVTSSGMRIVDGWHRVEALRKRLGRGATAEVDVRDYESDAEALKDAIRLNDPAGRGLPLDQRARERSVVLLEQHGVTVTEIAAIVEMPEKSVKVILIPEQRPAPTSPEAKETANRLRKRAQDREGERDASSETGSRSGPGRLWWVSAHCQAITLRLENGTISPESDTRAVAALWRLHDLTEEKLPRP